MLTANSSQEVELFSKDKLLSPIYWANFTAQDKIVINQGGTFSGKTYSIMMVLFTIAVMRPGYVITVTSNTVTKLKEDALRIAKDLVSKNPVLKSCIESYNSTDRVYTFTNGSIMEFKSFENDEQAKGGKRHILYICEATRIPFMTFFEANLRTTVRTFMDYNPTSTFWVHERVINNPLQYKSVKVIRSWHEHNPYISADQRDQIESIQDKDLYKVYARGLTGILKGVIYSNWKEVEEFPWMDDVVWYLDFGLSKKESADPTAGGRIKINPKGADLDFVIDEVVHGQAVAMSAIAEAFFATGYKTGQMVYCDHVPGNIRELRTLGISAVPAEKGPGSVLSGVIFLKQQKIGYTKRSEHIKEELKKYRWFEVDGILTNTPVDEHNHHMDGARYGIRTHCLRIGRAA